MAGSLRIARKRERTRARLIAAATELIAEHGVEALRVREVTDLADVGFGSFYNHFENKEELIETVVTNAIEVTTERIMLGAEEFDDPAETAAVAHRAFIQIAYDDPQLARLLVNLDHADALLETASWPFLAPVLERGVETGRFAGVDVDVAVSFIVGATIGVMRGIVEERLGPQADVDSARTLLRACGLSDPDATAVAQRSGPKGA
jgi:AcrR family transcriptional regulator